jgi:hypothetical protein
MMPPKKLGVTVVVVGGGVSDGFVGVELIVCGCE